MKKFLALLLAAMMLLSCTTAMAESTTFDSILNDETHSWMNDDENETSNTDADIDVGVSTRYTDGEDTFGKEGQAATELWLQVDATGQIDVTVPLVLVFQTNIDGGNATSPSDYKFTNHSSADLVVTKIATTKVAYDEEKQPMKMIAFDGSYDEDTYGVQIKNIGGQAGTYGDVATTYDLYVADTTEGVTNTDTTVLHENEAANGGLFELEKAPANNYDDGTPTTLEVEMKTGRLSFVTSRTVDRDDEEAVTSDVMDDYKNDEDEVDARGVHLMTITYTVAIDTSDAIGDEITTEENRDDTDRILSTNNKPDTKDTAAADFSTRIGEIKASSAEDKFTTDDPAANP